MVNGKWILGLSLAWTLGGCFSVEPDPAIQSCQSNADCEAGQQCLSDGRCEKIPSTQWGEAPRPHLADGFCPIEAPVSCSRDGSVGCCPAKLGYCCGGRCVADKSVCPEIVGEVCSPSLPGCTVCGAGEQCPANKPFCCDNAIGLHSCAETLTQCPGFARPTGCTAERPIACSDPANGHCCPEDRPHCCSNGECYATPTGCAEAVEPVCTDSGFPVNCGDNCCPTDFPYCCYLEDSAQGTCQSDPHYCGVVQKSG